jgi:hypothetical protein
MECIYKYDLEVTDSQIIKMPVDAKIIAVQTQREKPRLWAIVDVNNINITEGRRIAVYGTGQPHKTIGGKYIGTFQLANGNLVFHVFET